MYDFVGYLVTCDEELISLTEYLEEEFNHLHFQGSCIYRYVSANVLWILLQVTDPGSNVTDMQFTEEEYCGFSTINIFDHNLILARLQKYPEVDLITIKQYFDNDLIEEFVGTWEFINTPPLNSPNCTDFE